MFQDDDEGFWTREDLIDLDSEVESILISSLPDCYVTVLDSYVSDDDRTFTLTARIDDYELVESIKIDMRKLKYTTDLASVYAKQFANMFIADYNNAISSSIESATTVLSNEAIRADHISGDITDVDDDILEDIYHAVHDKVIEFVMSDDFGFDAEDAEYYSRVTIRPFEDDDNYIMVEVGTEIDFEGQVMLCTALDEVIEKFDPESYFDMEDIGLSVAAVRKQCLQTSHGVYADTEDEDDYEIENVDQEFTSENTSINSNKLPAIFHLVDFKPGTMNLDYGGGKFDNAIEYLAEMNVTNLVYDPFNRSADHNKMVLSKIRSNGGADTATCSNVLNVIKEPEARINVLKNIAKLIKSSGTVYITVYEGSGSNEGAPTKSGYQLNRKTADYLEEIESVFSDVKRRGKLIVCKK